MASLITKFKKALLIGIASVLLILVFIIDIIRRSVEIDLGWILLVREIVAVVSFVIFYILIESLWKREQPPAKKLGFALVIALAIGTATGLLYIISPSGFELKVTALLPLGFDSVVWSNIYSVVLSITMIMTLLILRDILYAKRRKGTKRNFIILLGLMIITSLTTLTAGSLETGMISTILYIVTVSAMLFNSFRVSWIVYLSKREKILSIIFGFLLFCIFIAFNIIISRDETLISRSVLFYSPALQSFVSLVSLFAAIYFGMTFISTLFHLPTAEAFDRKLSEVSSLHNLSKLVTQVFDFNELVESVTTMTLDVCEAKSSWLEIIQTPRANNPARKLFGNNSSHPQLTTVAHKNISREETDRIMLTISESLRKQIIDGRKPIVID
ncbi:MAG: hypothetical protein HY800_06230, partial [Ignavibacteriales bacterium]|nr:hypothetical protein [Ignavibacteriales bacterium]